jgi:hypothetical protein
MGNVMDVKKRTFDRYQIPGAFVTFKKSNKILDLHRSSKPLPLINLTKSGICFVSDKKFKYGDCVTVKIKIPGEKSLSLDVNVRWLKNNIPGERFHIGAQIRPFGKGNNYNSVRTLERLRELDSKYKEDYA